MQALLRNHGRIVLLGALLALPGLAQSQNNIAITTPSAGQSGGADNTLVGVGAGNLNMSGSSNLILGKGAGLLNMGGQQNSFVGASSGSMNSSGSYNSFFGYESGKSTTSGNNNTFLGTGSGFTNSTGFNNLFSGHRSGYFNTIGANNTFLGTGSGYSNIGGSENTFVGSDAGSSNSTAGGNVFVGAMAGTANTTGQNNVFLGASAGQGNQTGEQNVFIGFNAGYNTTTSANLMIGFRSGFSNTVGNFNTFIGTQAGLNNTSGSGNFMMGTNAGVANTSGASNFFLGDNAGANNTTGSYNLYLGSGAGAGTGVNGNNNTSVGFTSGQANIGGVGNTFLGIRADASASNLTNAAAIGADAKVAVSNAIVLGNNVVNVGIGTSSPTARLHVATGVSGQSGLRLANLTSANSTTLLNQTKFLTVDNLGNVVLASVNGSGARVAATELWQADGDNMRNTNIGGIIIGQGITKTPVGYGLYVGQGILTERVKVAIHNQSDWSDYVFDKKYRLRSLSEVERYVKENKHLPGVPSAKDVVREGVDVASMDAKLLEKVEELTLYMIQLKKDNQKLAQKTAELVTENKVMKQQLRKLSTRK